MSIAKIGGANLYYEDTGRGEPVLFLHGFPLSGQMWAEAVAALKDRCRCIVLDLRALGRSDGDEGATMRQYADDVVALLDHLGESRPAVIVGLSMGGYVAFELYRRHPSRVRALGLIDTHPRPDTPEKRKERQVSADNTLRQGSIIMADGMLPLLFGKQASEALRKKWHAIMNATRPEGIAAALRAMADREDSIPTLSTIRVPTMIVVGEEDVITPPDIARFMHEHVAGSELHIMPKVGHMAPVEAPETFAKLLRDFVDRVKSIAHP